MLRRDFIALLAATSLTSPALAGLRMHGGGSIPLPAPTVISVSPGTGDIAGGTSVTITGTAFTGATTVTFGGSSASFTVVNSTTITATTPAHAVGAVNVAVTTPNGTGTGVNAYTYTTSGATIVLSLVSSPEYTNAKPAYYIQMPKTKGNGTVIQLQTQIAGGSWSSLIVNTSNTLNSTQNEYESISNSQASLSSGSYQSRAIVDGVTSNVVSFTV